jgi:RNA polymerase sigma-70 factor (ECF subfamily)
MEIMTSNSHKPGGHCRKMSSVFSRYLDRELQKTLCRKLESHLARCPDCRMYLDTMKKTITLYRSLESEPLPKATEKRLFATIRLASRSRPKKK